MSTTSVATNLDGTHTEYFEVECSEASLLALLRACFEEHWGEVIFGPCIEGAVFEGRFTGKPRISLFDGYATVDVAGDVPGRQSWHFHLCIGPHRGSPALPTPPELASGAAARAPRSSATSITRVARAPGAFACGMDGASRCSRCSFPIRGSIRRASATWMSRTGRDSPSGCGYGSASRACPSSRRRPTPSRRSLIESGRRPRIYTARAAFSSCAGQPVGHPARARLDAVPYCRHRVVAASGVARAHRALPRRCHIRRRRAPGAGLPAPPPRLRSRPGQRPCDRRLPAPESLGGDRQEQFLGRALPRAHIPERAGVGDELLRGLHQPARRADAARRLAPSEPRPL